MKSRIGGVGVGGNVGRDERDMMILGKGERKGVGWWR